MSVERGSCKLSVDRVHNSTRYTSILTNFIWQGKETKFVGKELSERALFKPVKATLNLSGITAMNTAMTNVLLAKMVFTGNPSSPINIIKKASERVIDNVLDRIEYGELTKGEIKELTEIADAYRSVLKAI